MQIATGGQGLLGLVLDHEARAQMGRHLIQVPVLACDDDPGLLAEGALERRQQRTAVVAERGFQRRGPIGRRPEIATDRLGQRPEQRDDQFAPLAGHGGEHGVGIDPVQHGQRNV